MCVMKTVIFVFFIMGVVLENFGFSSEASLLPAELQKLTEYSKPDYWEKRFAIPKIEREKLITAIEAMRAYYLNNQLPDGTFLYILDITKNEKKDIKHQVRGAGALWGLSCLDRERFTKNSRLATMKGLNFFIRNEKKLLSGNTATVFPGEKIIDTGTAALYSLALIEFIRGQDKRLPPEIMNRYRVSLEHQLKFLRYMELANGSWSEGYDVSTGFRSPAGSPYYDGECLLAYVKAAKYLKKTELLARIDEALPKLIEKYTVNCWKPGQINDDCKGFSQWGCMAMGEYVEAGWEENADLAAKAALSIAWWLIDYNKLEWKNGNTGYAVEGLMGAWQVARKIGDTKAMAKLQEVSERVMGRLLTMQVQGPYAQNNEFLALHKRRLPQQAYGGVLMAPQYGQIRIDNVQHQLHAMLMMLDAFYPEGK